MLVVDAASVLVGIRELEDGLLIPEVVVPVLLVPTEPEVVLLPSPEVVLEWGFVVEERGLLVPVLLLLPRPVDVLEVPVVPDCPEPYMTSSSFVLPGLLQIGQSVLASGRECMQAYIIFLILSMIGAQVLSRSIKIGTRQGCLEATALARIWRRPT